MCRGVKKGTLASAAVGGASGSSEQGVSSAPEGTSGVGTGVSAAVGVETGASPSSVSGVDVAGTSEALGVSIGAPGTRMEVISKEQGVLEGSRPMVGLGMSVLSVKSEAWVGLKYSDAGVRK